ncbi:MAG TPA: hypothetical protein VFC84_14115 [Desulfosporosinus sp.]|nr:hypothetical protein [Desulfosporosinus sp.]
MNDSGAYILVRAIMGKNSLTINFYGQPQPGRHIVIANSSTPVPPPEQHVFKFCYKCRFSAMIKHPGK